MKSKHLALLLLCIAAFPISAKAQVSPIQGLGSIQLFDNNGNIATAGCFYFYQAGTTTQQATFTDSTGTTQNTNPLCVSTGARATVWLSTSLFYKIVGCLANDGSFCAPSDVLFSQDNVPGGATSGGGGGGSPFISSSANPATAGILRLATSDTVCWRNAANSANLCISKDSSDVITFPFGALKMGETACSLSGFGFDYWCADSSSHHWKWTANNSSQFFSPGIATAGVSGNVVTLAANGIDIQDSGHSETYLNFEMILSGPISSGASTPCTAAGGGQACFYYNFVNAHTLSQITVSTSIAPSGCGTNAVVGIKDLTASTVLLSATPTVTGIVVTSGSVAIPAGHNLGVGILTSSSGCGVNGLFTVSANYQ